MTTTTDSTNSSSAKLKQLQDEGYCILENVADEALLERTRDCVNHAIATLDVDQLTRNVSPGTLIDSGPHPELAGIVGNPTALKALNDMGLQNSKFWKAVIISKPSAGPRLYWHQDCLMWQDPRSYSDIPPMIFLMYYMEDTTRENGWSARAAGNPPETAHPPRHGRGAHTRH